MRHNRFFQATALTIALSVALATPVLAGGGSCCQGNPNCQVMPCCQQREALTADGVVGQFIQAMFAGTLPKIKLTRPELESKLANRGWAGIELQRNAESGQIEVVRVVVDSPAARAGLRAGDVLLALAGIELLEGNEAALDVVRSAMTPGNRVTYTIERDGEPQRIAVRLAQIPKTILAKWIDLELAGEEPEIA
jgi:predicted metalloprotease with PDZ domain